MLLSGLDLMLIGMGIVFSLPILLVWIIQRTHGLLLRFEPPETVPLESATGGGPAGSTDETRVAAIHPHEHRR